MKEVNKVYDEFWKDIIEPDGIIDFDQVKRELYDYRTCLMEVPKVYDEITNGKISKPNTTAEYVLDEFYDRLKEAEGERKEDG